MKHLQDSINATYVNITSAGKGIDLLTEQDDDMLFCAPFYDEESKHAILTRGKHLEGAPFLYDLLRLEDHIQATRIFDTPESVPGYVSASIVGFYNLVVNQRVLRAMNQHGVTGEDWAFLVAPYHQYKNTFHTAKSTYKALTPLWTLTVAHAYADAWSALSFAKVPSARSALKAIKANPTTRQGIELAQAIIEKLDSFQDTRQWVEETFIDILKMADMAQYVEIRDAKTGALLQEAKPDLNLF